MRDGQILPATEKSVAADVLEEPEVATGTQHAPDLGKGGRQISNRAEHEGGDNAIERRVLERQRLRRRKTRHDVGAAEFDEAGLRPLQHVRIGLDRDHVNASRVVREVRAGPRTDLEHVPVQASRSGARRRLSLFSPGLVMVS